MGSWEWEWGGERERFDDTRAISTQDWHLGMGLALFNKEKGLKGTRFRFLKEYRYYISAVLRVGWRDNIRRIVGSLVLS